MKVLLTEQIESLGMTGDVVEVADGYGRNYLLPKGLAVEPTEENQKKYEKLREKRKEKIEERREWAQEAYEKLDGLQVEVRRKAQEDAETLYGSVRKEDLVDLVEESVAIELNPGQIDLDRPLEKLGSFEVPLNLYEDIEATIEVVVRPEGEEENQPPEEDQEET